MKLIKDYIEISKILANHEMYNRGSRAKRTINRLIKNIEQGVPFARNLLKQYYKIYITPQGSSKYPKLRVSNMIILPFMINKRLAVYNGKSYNHVFLTQESIGRYVGEYLTTRTKGKKEIIKKESGPKGPKKSKN